MIPKTLTKKYNKRKYKKILENPTSSTARYWRQRRQRRQSLTMDIIVPNDALQALGVPDVRIVTTNKRNRR